MLLRRRAGNEVTRARLRSMSDRAAELCSRSICILEDDTSGVAPTRGLGRVVQSRAIGHEWKLVPWTRWAVGKAQGAFGGSRVVHVLFRLTEVHFEEVR